MADEQHLCERQVERVDARGGELHFDVQPGGAAESTEDAARPEAVGS